MPVPTRSEIDSFSSQTRAQLDLLARVNRNAEEGRSRVLLTSGAVAYAHALWLAARLKPHLATHAPACSFSLAHAPLRPRLPA